MVNVERTFSVQPTPDVIVDYLSDFSRAEHWDPGTVSCTRNGDGPIKVGSTWHNVSKFKGRETELTYELTRWDSDHLVFVGKNKTATSTDDITVTAQGTGSSITYRANIEFHGVAKLAAPFLKSEFEKLGDEAVKTIPKTLNAL